MGGARVRGADRPWARLVCSHRDLQGARGGGPRGRPARAPAPTPAPTAAEVHEIGGHQGHEQQGIETQG